jgi:hypothetical protein
MRLRIIQQDAAQSAGLHAHMLESGYSLKSPE